MGKVSMITVNGKKLFICIFLIFLISIIGVQGVTPGGTLYSSGWSCENTECVCDAERCYYPLLKDELAPQGAVIFLDELDIDLAVIKALPLPKKEWWNVEIRNKGTSGAGVAIIVSAYDKDDAIEKMKEIIKEEEDIKIEDIDIAIAHIAKPGVPILDVDGSFLVDDQGNKIYAPKESRIGEKWYISPESPEWAWNPEEEKWVPSSQVPLVAELDEGSAPLPEPAAPVKPSTPASSQQVQKGTVGAKVEGAAVYEGCRNKRFGLVGASNTWDTNPDGSSIPLTWRNVKIIQDFCPGATVFLHAKGGASPEAQVSLLAQVLANDNLDYVIIDPSANGQFEFSLWSTERYKNAVIKLAQMVKEKNPAIKVVILTNTPLKGAIGEKNVVIGTDAVVQKVKAFNANLLNIHLGRSDLIDYAVDTYSATEDPLGSDSCGKYCGLDKLHFGEAGRKRVMKAVMDKVFGAPTATATVVTNTAVSPTSSTAAENCLNSLRCQEIDQVWLKIVQWINAARRGQIFDTIKGSFRPFEEVRPTVVITPPPTIPPAKVTELATANKLYKDILTNLPNQNLAKAIVANAKGESGLNHMASGDCGEYGEKNSGSSIPIGGKGRCCSFGLWQYNICGGLGTTFLQSYGSPSTDQAKLAVVHDYQKNVDFMVSYLKKTYPNEIQQQKSVEEWVAWFVREIERPANPSGEITKRQGFARELESAGAFSDSSTLTSTQPTTPSIGQASFSTSGYKQSGGGWLCPQDAPQPNAGLTEAPGEGGCPAGMVKVSTFCIDKYEASLVQMDGKPWSPYCDPKLHNVQVKAVSLANAVPQSNINQIQAKAACENAGKRLCTDEEWSRACQGAQGNLYPYGSTQDSSACNRRDSSPHVVERLISTNPEFFPGLLPPSNGWNRQPFMQHPAINQQSNTLTRTGEKTACVTAERVYDLYGNVYEWTADPDGTFRGDYYQFTPRNPTNEGCLNKVSGHAASYSDYSIGFRCCANPTS